MQLKSDSRFMENTNSREVFYDGTQTLIGFEGLVKDPSRNSYRGILIHRLCRLPDGTTQVEPYRAGVTTNNALSNALDQYIVR